MKVSHSSLFLFAAILLLAACASEQTVTKTQVRKDWRGKEVPFTVGKDKDGNPVMKSDRRSSFEGKTSGLVGGRDFQGKDYTKTSYRKKRWFGNTVFSKKEYRGNTDASRYKREPWFVQKQASASGKRSRADGKNYSVNPFSTTAARERQAVQISRTSDAETSVRRRVFKQPDIIHWQEQRGLTIKDTNKMLGR